MTIAARAWMEDGQIVLEFCDRGPGYPPQVLHLGERNVGLALVESIVTQSLRGALTLHNDSGAVAVVRFAAEVMDAAAESSPVTSAADGAGEVAPAGQPAMVQQSVAMGDEG